MTLPVVIICGLVAMLSTAAFLGFQGGALGRLPTCGSIAADFNGPTDHEREAIPVEPTEEFPHPLPRLDQSAIEHNKTVKCTKSAHDQLPKLVLFSALWGLGVALGLTVLARLLGPSDRASRTSSTQPTTETLTAQLERLSRLRESGALTDDEFAAAKAAAIQRGT